MTVKTPTATASGNQPPCAILIELAAKNDRSKERNSASSAAPSRSAQLPAIARHEVEEHRGDGHRARHRDAVGGGQVARRAEAEHQRHAGDHQQPVDLGDVDLPLGRAPRCARCVTRGK